VKRILVSLFLLATALIIPKPFTTELEHFSMPIEVTGNYLESPNPITEQKQSASLPSTGCPCDTPTANPTITLVLIAAIAAWLAMASFIYGSHFIAALVAS
jgi:hypothetical protein